MKKICILICCTVALFAACRKPKEIEVKLPDYDSKMVVECYLEPGKPYRLSIQESVSYFDPPQLPTVDSALVIISHNNISDTIQFMPFFDPTTLKAYNYVSGNSVICPYDYTSVFTLYVLDRKGRVATASAVIPKPPEIDSVGFKYNEDSMAYPVIRFKDDLSTHDFYRYILTKDNLQGSTVSDYLIDDALNQTNHIETLSGFKLGKKDPFIARVYHISQPFYDFLVSVSGAISANGNPFGQPAVIRSNIQGGLGIFAGLSYDQVQMNIP